MPFASEVDTTLLSVAEGDCHTTATLGSGLPAPSVTRAVRGVGN